MTWVVNLEDATATHPDGWVFRFAAVEGEAGVFDGVCIGQPPRLSASEVAGAARVAQEAGSAFIKARSERH